MKKIAILHTILSIVTLLFVIWNFFATYFIIMKIEYSKVGGKENYEILNKLQMDQIKQVIDYYKQNPDAAAWAGQEDTNTNNEDKTISDVSALKDGYFVEGNKDAEITWIEYSDLECPFCKKLHDSGTKNNVIAKYEGKVNYMFKHFPLDFHKNAQKEAEALECAGEIAGGDAYFKMKDEIFTRGTAGGEGFALEKLPELAGELGVDKDAFTTCLESGKYAEKVASAMAEGQWFGINGTPGNLIINNKTGKYEVVSWAQPQSNFESVIDKLLWE